MADNRLYLKCKYCGATILLCKCLGSPMGISPKACTRMNNFFEEHMWCGNEKTLTGGWFTLLDEEHDGFSPLSEKEG